MREVIVLHPVGKKHLSPFMKTPPFFPRIVLGRQVVKWEKNNFVLGGKRFWRGIVVSRTRLGW
jgi:hypothetical protein